MEPIMEFKDDAELNKCLDYWKENYSFVIGLLKQN